MLNNIIFEQDCDKRLAEFKYNAKEKYYKLVKSFKINSKLLSMDQIRKIFIDKNKNSNNDYAFMVLDVNATPADIVSMPCRICDYKQ